MTAKLIGYAESGLTTAKFVRKRKSDGAWWNTSGTPAFEEYSVANIAQYGIAATETGLTGMYTATDPAEGTEGDLLLVKAAGASLAVSDLVSGARWQDLIQNLPSAAPGAAGGLVIAGSNAPTTFAGSGSTSGLTITGGTTALGALSLIAGTTSGAGIKITVTSGYAILAPAGISSGLTGSVGSIASPPGLIENGAIISATSTTATIPTDFGIDDIIVGNRFKLTGGTTGVQERTIIGYVHSTQVLTVDRPWTIIPAFNDPYQIYSNNSPKLDSSLGVALSSTERDAIATALLDLADGIETGESLREALRLIRAAAVGLTNGFPGGPFHFRDKADSKNRITGTSDTDGNRLTVTTDAS